MWIVLLIILAAVVAIALLSDDIAPAVKQRDTAEPCTQCGKPTWSANGLCVRCRGITVMTPIPSTHIEAPPVVAPPFVTAAPREVQTDSHGRIAEDIGCSACGYNLRGLTPTSTCPECALPIGLSIKGDLLQFSNPHWVERLARGAMFIIIGIFANIAFSILFGMGNAFLTIAGAATVPVQLAMGFVGALVSGITVFGGWLLTTRDPSKAADESMFSARRITRWTMFAGLTHWPMQMALTATMGTGALNVAVNPLTAPTPAFMILSVVSLAFQLFGMIAYVAGMALLRAMALRIPRRSLATQTSIAMWGYGVSLVINLPSAMLMQWLVFAINQNTTVHPIFAFVAIGACVGTLGTVVFGIWAIVLLFLYHSSFKQCAAAAKSIWSQAAVRQTPPAFALD